MRSLLAHNTIELDPPRAEPHPVPPAAAGPTVAPFGGRVGAGVLTPNEAGFLPTSSRPCCAALDELIVMNGPRMDHTVVVAHALRRSAP
jgi:hypothetical protein